MVSDRYYKVCELNEEVFQFQPLSAELQLLAPTSHLQMSVTKKHLVLSRKLAEIHGFTQTTFNVDKTFIAGKSHRPIDHREICAHLVEMSTSDNLHKGRPSTLLRSVLIDKGVGAVGLKHSPSCNTKV